MKRIGKLESAWRYPVKGMRGEQVNDVFVAYTGVMGDHLCAIWSWIMSCCASRFRYRTMSGWIAMREPTQAFN
jgi:uncharacterized protein YcbX